MKSFVLALYYRSKKDFNQARHYYDVYLTSKHVNNDIGVIMDSVWNGKAKVNWWLKVSRNLKTRC